MFVFICSATSPFFVVVVELALNGKLHVHIENWVERRVLLHSFGVGFRFTKIRGIRSARWS